MIGHSKGGAEAITNAFMTNTNCITFNPLAQNLNLDATIIKNYTRVMIHFVVEGEVLNKWFGEVKVGQTIYLDTQVFKTNKKPDDILNHNMPAIKSGLKAKGYKSWKNVPLSSVR